MADSESGTELLASSLHRSILGGLLAILGLVGLSLARGLTTGRPLLGSVGVLLAVGAGLWIAWLFREAVTGG